MVGNVVCKIGNSWWFAVVVAVSKGSEGVRGKVMVEGNH